MAAPAAPAAFGSSKKRAREDDGDDEPFLVADQCTIAEGDEVVYLRDGHCNHAQCFEADEKVR